MDQLARTTSISTTTTTSTSTSSSSIRTATRPSLASLSRETLPPPSVVHEDTWGVEADDDEHEGERSGVGCGGWGVSREGDGFVTPTRRQGMPPLTPKTPMGARRVSCLHDSILRGDVDGTREALSVCGEDPNLPLSGMADVGGGLTPYQLAHTLMRSHPSAAAVYEAILTLLVAHGAIDNGRWPPSERPGGGGGVVRSLGPLRLPPYPKLTGEEAIGGECECVAPLTPVHHPGTSARCKAPKSPMCSTHTPAADAPLAAEDI
ncbi:unnamed protein product [Vitrella brassicaformis CCMP3155]|uniref:Uncharacterized protein n=1 Tax=Vitrella brassicaformis (strain CCMP3155) TaxID=1169540 RepID=A0A0G4GBA9_VITBC|nr:unnamed protein product [Vitrella brassicaformis CCMP3155]|eukprot:CEM26412.1 unnamed protein product [Vitrella brassicaformis CCMP3155]